LRPSTAALVGFIDFVVTMVNSCVAVRMLHADLRKKWVDLKGEHARLFLQVLLQPTATQLFTNITTTSLEPSLEAVLSYSESVLHCRTPTDLW